MAHLAIRHQTTAEIKSDSKNVGNIYMYIYNIYILLPIYVSILKIPPIYIYDYIYIYMIIYIYIYIYDYIYIYIRDYIYIYTSANICVYI